MSFVFVVFAIYVLGLDSSELLQRHFGARSRISFSRPNRAHTCAGIVGFLAIHQMGNVMQTITTPRS
jgi:hypothetical protein